MAGNCSVLVPPGGRCRFHGTAFQGSPEVAPRPTRAASAVDSRNAAHVRAVPDAIARRDIGGVCWLIVERALDESSGDGRGPAAAVSALRVLVGLPPAGKTAEAARKEAFLRGKVMHGIAPQSPEEWALAEEIFKADAIAEFRRWELWERDDGYVDEPLPFGELAGDESEPPAVVDDED